MKSESVVIYSIESESVVIDSFVIVSNCTYDYIYHALIRLIERFNVKNLNYWMCNDFLTTVGLKTERAA